MSSVMCHKKYFFFFFGQIGDASQGRFFFNRATLSSFKCHSFGEKWFILERLTDNSRQRHTAKIFKEPEVRIILIQTKI